MFNRMDAYVVGKMDTSEQIFIKNLAFFLYERGEIYEYEGLQENRIH